MRKVRTTYKRGTVKEITERNEKMFKKYLKMATPKKIKQIGKMGIYQQLADEFGFPEKNSVATIINKMRNAEPKIESV